MWGYLQFARGFSWHGMVWTKFSIARIGSKYCWTKQCRVLQTTVWQSITLCHPCLLSFAFIHLLQTQTSPFCIHFDVLNSLHCLLPISLYQSSLHVAWKMAYFSRSHVQSRCNWAHEPSIDFLSNGCVASLIYSDVLMISQAKCVWRTNQSTMLPWMATKSFCGTVYRA